MNKTIKEIINKIETTKSCSVVPDKYKNNKDIIRFERKEGLRVSGRKGFDIFNNIFFIEEKCQNNNSLNEEIWLYELKEFTTFDEYYDYLDGDIYSDSCYYQYDFSDTKKKVDIAKINCKAFICKTIDDFDNVKVPTEYEIEQYKKGEINKQLCKKWIEKFNSCEDFESFNKIVDKYWKSDLKRDVDLVFFFYQYIYKDIKNEKRFDLIMQYMSTGKYPEDIFVKALCHLYDSDKVLAAYNYSAGYVGAKSTFNKHKRELKKYATEIKNRNINNDYSFGGFDKKCHYFYDYSNGTYRYFESFEEFVDYRNGDLSGCDLSQCILLDCDFSKYKTDEKTELPYTVAEVKKYVIKKEYSENYFYVYQTWIGKNNEVIKKDTHRFKYFFDFVFFLKGDLSDANLLNAKGLKNLKDYNGLNFENAKLTSEICDKLNISYEIYEVNSSIVSSFSEVKENEETTGMILSSKREVAPYDKLNEKFGLINCLDISHKRIHYISDLHLMHDIIQRGLKSVSDIENYVSEYINIMIDDSQKIILIGGDVSSDYYIFELFVKMLRESLDDNYHIIKPDVIFILGNHELWSFEERSFSDIVEKYRNLINKNGMFLLQNNIFYMDEYNKLKEISSENLINYEKDKIRKILRKTNTIFFGGLAFSGYNKKFNANDGIYRNVISRNKEIAETKKFEKLYFKISDALYDKNLIVLTHTPIDCWMKIPSCHKNFIYINGHTHKNDFYDDGEIRVYADNQLGYKTAKPFLKWFYVDGRYDFFSSYDDGIYEISKEEYEEFYRGINIEMSMNWQVYKILMLKKNGYYCFLHQNEWGYLYILNGGAKKNLESKNIKHYYDNMDKVIDSIKKPLDKYSSAQKKISELIIKLGGKGTIHGCIIDIDYYNHIYLNPFDMKITAYWASDIINKVVYPNITSLLEEKRPEMFIKYNKMVESKEVTSLALYDQKKSTKIERYTNTDIYKSSREINRMQRLESMVLTTWHEPGHDKNRIEKR